MVEIWKGRLDSFQREDLRFWQIITTALEMEENSGVCFVGYNTDDGVNRNQGRVGAEGGSDAIRTAMKSYPIVENVKLYDFGNLENKKLEEAQEEYSDKVKMVLEKKNFPIGLGGGHDIAYASYLGLRKAYPDKKIGIINFDTHLDMRDYSEGGTSGTSFKQILDSDKEAKYMIIGYKDIGNTERLREEARKNNVVIIKEEYSDEYIYEEIRKFSKEVDIIQVTFCMDVFDASIAPGVSAPTILGLEGKRAIKMLKKILETKKVAITDIAEVNPQYDIDNRTAKLAGNIIYEIVQSKSS
ncbi:formimidoylglutamase [Fusobacterium sp. MFO224]|uniref:formimidoylglutamase n=1 Tax=Fusobacterium sp. MFO224 TaxID=3378070 RepID=UPI0038529ABF